ncbi:MAG: S49 family peptidase, partial [Myxococcota bacterium]
MRATPGAATSLERITVSTQWRLTEDEPLNEDTLDLGVRAEVELLAGLNVGVGVDTNLDVFGQIGFDFGAASTGGFFGYVDERVRAGGELVFRSVPAPRLLEPSRVVVMGLSGSLVSEPELDLLQGAYRVEPYGRVERILRALAAHDRVDGVFLRIGSLAIGWAKAEGLRRALLEAREAGLRVDCHLPGAGDVEYYVASACTQILVFPAAVLDVDGLAAVRLYYGEALARFGVSVEVERVGAYKNGPDVYSRASMSDEERERIEAWQEDVYDVHLSALSTGRQLDRSAVSAALARGV